MSGPAPKATRRRRNEPTRGEWTRSEAVGWQHGDPPKPPPRLLKATRDAWTVWMGSFFAAHWIPDDLPGLRQIARLYDQVERGEFQRAGELRLQMDGYGMTPKGQQDRRWARPTWVVSEPPTADDPEPTPEAPDPYVHLRVVGD
jgi:hypothetical protein